MEELDLIIQDFEKTCSTLAITHDSPCEEMIKQKFEEYHKVKLKLLGIGDFSQQHELLMDLLEQIKLASYSIPMKKEKYNELTEKIKSNKCS